MTMPSPAESAILAAGFEVDPREMPQLVRLVARRLPADRHGVGEALCEVRRKTWAGRMLDLANRVGRNWIGREDARAAAALITTPEPDDDALRGALDQVVYARLRDAGATPQIVLDSLAAEVAETSGALMAAERFDDLARQVAQAWSLYGDASAAFVNAATQMHAQRRRETREAGQEARLRRREEVARLREWERSLVPFRAVPELLGCSKGEGLRWVGAGRIPVARKVAERNGGERWDFDPAALVDLRAQVAVWRAEDAIAADQAKSKTRKGKRTDAPEPQAPALLVGRAANEAVARVAALDRYAAHFRTARALNRRITLVTGPTNSGKSYTALNRLAGADSGMALAPLRLLAHEFREALAGRGVAASLSTGEERDIVPGSRHLAATVEMCPMNAPVDVALIDEAQMLFDRDRGAAWTAAIMGVPARDVFVLGAPDCIEAVRRIAQLCDDPVEEITLQRKGPLKAASQPVSFGQLRRGDALVAFSRRDVLDLRAELVARGRTVAVIYGALSPEVRRAEAARFNRGEAEILVATDAIGMGLNLDIRRVVFGALRKFDGQERRLLNAQEVKQIGGRAGRYGLHEEGIVSVLAGAGDPEVMISLLHAAPQPPEDLRPLVQPDADIVRAVAAEIGSESLFGVLARIRRAVLRRDDPNYRLADMAPQFAIATALEGVRGLTLLERWTYAMCPVDDRDNGVTRLAHWANEHAALRPVRPPAVARFSPPDRAGREELERAEKLHKRLVAWCWLQLRFPEIYVDRAFADAEMARVNDWVEAVLQQQRRPRPEAKPQASKRPGRPGPKGRSGSHGPLGGKPGGTPGGQAGRKAQS